MTDPYAVILEPVISEKATDRNAQQNKVIFRVSRNATKQQIKTAVERIYPKVQVQEVRTLVMPGKKKRLRMSVGHTPVWKKAVVQLKEGSRIEFQ